MASVVVLGIWLSIIHEYSSSMMVQKSDEDDSVEEYRLLKLRRLCCGGVENHGKEISLLT